MSEPKPCLHICITCRAGLPLAEGEIPQGAALHATIAAALDGLDDPPVVLRAVTCLASCERGCTAAISMSGKWSYLLGDLSPSLTADLLTYARAYGASRTGTIMPSRRPESLKTMILARIPALDMHLQEAAE